jgi:peptidoglycan biosynthesis protein MviN/MurJ (putative lipid II flippase)
MTSLLRFDSLRKGAFYSSAFALLSAGMAFGTSILVAAFFGASTSTDIYMFCISSVVTGGAVLVSSMNASVVIPESLALFAKHGQDASRGLLNRFLIMYVVGGVAIGAIVLLGLEPLLGVFTGFSRVAIAQHIWLFRASILYFVLLIPTLHFADILVSRRFFTLPALLSLSGNLIVLLLVWLGHDQLGIESALIGVLLSTGMQLCVTVTVVGSVFGWRFLDFRTIQIDALWSRLVLSEAAYMVSNFASYLPFMILSTAVPGTLTAFGYANRFIALPSLLFIGPLAKVLGTRFNELGPSGRWGQVERTLSLSMQAGLLVLLPVAAASILWPDQILSALFQRGKFGAQDVALSSTFLVWLGPVPALVLVNGLFSQLFVAARRTNVLSIVQIVSNALVLVAMPLLVRWMGAPGTAASILFSYASLCIAWPFLCRRFLPVADVRPSLRASGLFIFMNVPAFVGTLLLDRIILHQLGYWGVALGVGVYVVLLALTIMVTDSRRVLTESLYAIVGKERT